MRGGPSKPHGRDGSYKEGVSSTRSWREPSPYTQPSLPADRSWPRWVNLFLASYTVPREMLLSRLPAGLELDTRDGQAFVSLVAFDFLDTRILGVSWPGYRNFSELNLRFYVRRGTKRGVVFVREFVPHRLVAWMAHALYNERYLAAGLTSAARDVPGQLSVEYRLTFAGGVHILAATGLKPVSRPPAESPETFFKEHAGDRGGLAEDERCATRSVTRFWDVYPVTDYRIELD